ncbi:MAG: GIY-YIG nuclease family protein [Bacteroidales bacterium]|nr:GIY-YIG nuclease family protein [Bacteroidales bacterium]
MTNKYHNVLYTGCTTDIVRRVSQHKNHFYKGSFSDKYNCEYCVYMEEFSDYKSAINRENQIKNMSKKEKLDLIRAKNPEWKELVTEKGIVRAKEPWEQQVKRVISEIKKEMTSHK